MSDTLLNIFSYSPGEDVCEIHELPQLNWRSFAARTFASAVQRGKERGPLVVASCLAMRAGERAWWDDFNRWAAKAHQLGTVDRELLDSPLYKAVAKKLVKEERLYAASRAFRRAFESSFGYPVSKSPLWEGVL